MPDTQAEVLRVTWNWRTADGQTAHAAMASLRRSAVIQAVIMGAVAGLLIYGLHHNLVGRTVAGLAVVVLFLGLTFPAAYRPVHGFGQTLGRAVGQLLVYLLLVPFFFLFFTPAAIMLRVLGRDPLHRKFRAARFTYWSRRKPHPRGYNITKQFLHEDRDMRGELREVGSLPRRESETRS